MKTVPRFLRGPFRNALRVAMEEAVRPNAVRQERGWKLFLQLPRLLLHRPPRGGNVHKSKLVQKFEDFASGHWLDLLAESQKCAQDACTAHNRKKRRHNQVDDVQRRAARALALVQVGELSAGRQAWEGAALAPGTPTCIVRTCARPTTDSRRTEVRTSSQVFPQRRCGRTVRHDG